jgi:hypothetical protein
MSDARDSGAAFGGRRELRVDPVSFGGSGAARVTAWNPDLPSGKAAEKPAVAAPAPDPAAVEPQPADDGPCPNCDAILQQAEQEIDAVVEKLREPYLDAAAKLQQTAQDLTQWVRRDLVKLAVRLAESIVQRVVEIDPHIAEETVARALAVAGGVEAATIHVHPMDLEAIRGRAPELAAGISGKAVDIRVRPSDDVAMGSCMVSFEEGTVDARWHAQLLHLRDLLDAIVVSGPAARRGGGL